MKRHLTGLFWVPHAPASVQPVLAEDPARSVPWYGLAAGAFVSQFIGGDSGPATLLSRTEYSDTFNTGGGLQLEIFREFPDGWRAQIGFVHAHWSGKFFTGGEFPAGAQFGDFSLTGA